MEESRKKFIVRQSKIAYGVGIFIIGAALCLLLLEILYHVNTIPLWVYLVILAIFLLGVFVCLEVKNRQLRVENDEFYYRNILGKVKRFELHDIDHAKAAADFSRGRDSLCLYDEKGKMLCRLECSMKNADDLITYLYDNKIAVDMEKGAADSFLDIAMQQFITREEMTQKAAAVYEEADALVKNWKERNKKLGADFYYGFVEYYGSRIDRKAQIQPEECRCEKKGEELPEDYLCVMEVYVQKDGCFVRDQKSLYASGDLLVMAFPVFYQRESGALGEEYRLYYNGNCIKEMEKAFKTLERYLPGHKFMLEQMQLGYELRKTL